MHVRRSRRGHSGRRFGIMVVAYIVLLSSVAIISVTPQKASATTVDIEIQLDGAITKAKVGPGNSGVATMTGKVVIKKWPLANAQRISVSLTVDSGDWGATVSPPIMTFTQTDRAPKPITVFVMAPQTSTFQENKKVVVEGSWRAFPATNEILGAGEVRPDDLIVMVDQFYYVFLDSDEPFRSTWPGQPAEFYLTIENRGNGVDDFLIEVDNYKGLAEAGWAVEIERSSVTIAPGNITKVRIIAYPPYKNNIWSNYVMEIPIKVTSKRSVAAGVPDYQIYSLFCRQFGVDFDPILLAILIIIIAVVVLVVKWARDNFYI